MQRNLEETRRVTCYIKGCNGIHIPNVPLLRKVWEHIDAHPEEWQQNTWFNPVRKWVEQWITRDNNGRFIKPVKQGQYMQCGWTGCVAGWGAMFTGYRPVIGSGDTVIAPDGEEYGVEAVALHEFGMTVAEGALFYGKNTKQQVYDYMRDICQVVGEQL